MASKPTAIPVGKNRRKAIEDRINGFITKHGDPLEFLFEATFNGRVARKQKREGTGGSARRVYLELDTDQQLECAKKLVDYVYPKKSAVKVDTEGADGATPIVVLSYKTKEE